MGPDPKSTSLSRHAAKVAAETRSAAVHSGHLELEGTPQEAMAVPVARALLPLLTRDDGWLRLSSTDYGDVVYYKWKWTRGPNANKYVMVVYPAGEADEAFRRLTLKVHAVDRGEQSAVKDHYFQG